MKNVLIVGAGFAGAVYARELAEAGFSVTVIDRRSHIAGNAYDYVDDEGVRIHKYGPHVFHTNNPVVMEWLRRFAEWIPFELRVRAKIAPGRFAPLPVNRTTVETIFDVSLPTDRAAEEFLRQNAEPLEAINSAEDYLYSTIGKTLTNLLFRPYTKKMWDLDLTELSPSIVKRIPIRHDREDRYFPSDAFQCLPRDGYAGLFQTILSHDRISVSCEQPYEARMESDFDFMFTSAAIDEHYDYRFGELPYRSLRFAHSKVARSELTEWPIVNFTDDGPYTRQTNWSAFPQSVSAGVVGAVTEETPCCYRENGYERYYPVKTADDRYGQVYQRYKDLADADSSLAFIGRCGTYQYLDMHQVINQSLNGARKWIGRHA